MYTVTLQRGVKIKARNGVARSLGEVKRKYINKKCNVSEIKITIIYIGDEGIKSIRKKKLGIFSTIYCVQPYYISV